MEKNIANPWTVQNKEEPVDYAHVVCRYLFF